MSWIYNGEYLLLQSQIDEHYGFIYLITNIDNGRQYIGKKSFFSYRKGKRKKESNWLEYWGSSEELLLDIKKLGKSQFKREILLLCKTKGDWNYYEAKFQFALGVLEEPHKWYNRQIKITSYRNHLSCNRLFL